MKIGKQGWGGMEEFRSCYENNKGLGITHVLPCGGCLIYALF